MPTFVFTSPQGQEYEVDGPEGATEQQAFAILQQRIGMPSQPVPSNNAQGNYALDELKGVGRTAAGLGQTGYNMALGLGGMVAGGGAGLYKLIESGMDWDQATSAVQSAADMFNKFRIEQSSTGLKMEEGLGKLVEGGIDYTTKGLVSSGMSPELAKLVATIGVEAGLTFAPVIPKGVRAVGRGIEGLAKGGTDALARSVTAAGAPEIGVRPTIPEVPGAVQRVAPPPIADRISAAAEARVASQPRQLELEGIPPPMPPQATIAEQATTPERPSVATDLPFDRPKGEVPFYKPGSLRNLVDTPYLRALKVSGGENHPLVAGMRKMETDIIQKRSEFQPIEREYVAAYEGLPNRLQKEYKSAILKRDNERAIKILSQSRAVKNTKNAETLMGKIRGALDTRYGEMTDTGVKQRYIEGYHPSVIEDPAGWAKEFNKIMDEQVALGKKDKAILSSIEKTKAEVRNLTDEVQNGTLAFEEYSKKIDKLLNKDVIRKITDPKSQFSKERTMRVVPDRLQKYYKDPHAAMADYFTETAKVIAERKYLGKGYENVAEGIGNRLASELAAGRINEAQFVEWKKILEERFRPQTGGSKFLQKVKNAGYMATIGNPLSAAIQVLDIIPSAMRYGVGNTVKSVARTLTPGAKKITPQKIGLYETAHDLVNDPRARLLNTTLKVSGFKSIDRFGKTVILNAARNKFKKLASTDSGIKKLEKQGWRHIYDTPEAWEGFLSALKKGDFENPIVQEVAIAELLNTQPIAMSHMPISYLRSPNGRIFYMLKTWALRQVNQVRESIAKGNKYLATKLAAGIVLSNATAPHLRDMIAELFGAKPADRGEVSDQLTAAMARAVFLDPYALSKGVVSGKSNSLVAQFFGTPMADVLMSVIADTVKLYEEGGDVPLSESKSLRYTPIVGAVLNKVVKE